MLLCLSQAAGWAHWQAWAGEGGDTALGTRYGQEGLRPGTGNRHSPTATVKGVAGCKPSVCTSQSYLVQPWEVCTGDRSTARFLALVIAPGVEQSQSTDRYVITELIRGKKRNYHLEFILSETIMLRNCVIQLPCLAKS